ncbi:Gfo/Idh/MocA family oxidoreductase [soil metagenome]
MTGERPVQVGVAGLGRAFTLMLPTFLLDARVKLVAAFDPRAIARSHFERDFGGRAHADLQSLVDDPQVEAIYIASPHQYHAEQTRMAARAGKHVLVEKPMALTVADCDQMIADCRAAGVHLIVGHCHSFDSPYRLARDTIASGDLGPVRMIQALNYTDFLYRPRRPEELQTAEGGGVVYSQAAHQVDVVRLLAGEPIVRVRAVVGAWDPQRPTEGAYSALLWFGSGAFANLSYNGYGHFDSDEWIDWVGEMGHRKNPVDYGRARRRLATVRTSAEEAALKNAGTYGGPDFDLSTVTKDVDSAVHQHFGAIVVSCEHGDVRPVADGIWVYADAEKSHRPLQRPPAPRFEVIDELCAAVRRHEEPFHDGEWARETLVACVALLTSASTGADVVL